MSGDTRRTKGIQSGARSQRIVQSVREATMGELGRVGYAQMTVGGVAKAAGVNRATIYRRWPTKSDLVAALIESQLDRLDASPAADNLADDLVGLMRQFGENLTAPEGHAIARVLMSSHPELQELGMQARDRAKSAFQRAFERARERGELSEDEDVEVLLHLAFFGAVHWVLACNGVPPEKDCRRLVNAVLASTSTQRFCS